MVKNTDILKSKNEVLKFKVDEDSPFKRNDVVHIIQEYSLPKFDEVRCSFLNENKTKKCNTLHQNGFIVQKINGDYALLGNECSKYFGEDEEIRHQISQIRNERNRKKKFGVLLEYASHQLELKSRIELIRSELNNWLEKLEVVFNGNTPEFNTVISNGIKQGQITVSLKGIRYERNKFGDLTNKIEFSSNIEIGKIVALSTLNQELIKSLRARVAIALKALYEVVEILDKNHNTVDSKVIIRLSQNLNDIKFIQMDFEKFLIDRKVFLENNFIIATMLFSGNQSKKCVLEFANYFGINLDIDTQKFKRELVNTLKLQHKVDAIHELK